MLNYEHYPSPQPFYVDNVFFVLLRFIDLFCNVIWLGRKSSWQIHAFCHTGVHEAGLNRHNMNIGITQPVP